MEIIRCKYNDGENEERENRNVRKMVILQKLDDDTIYCNEMDEVSELWVADKNINCVGKWKKGGTIVLDELEEILG